MSDRRAWWATCARFTASSAIGVAAAGSALAWAFGRYTEFDRPSVSVSLPFIAGAALWSLASGVVVLARAGHAPSQRSVVVATGALAAMVVLYAVAAPAPPFRQGLVAAGCVIAGPLVAWAAMAFPGIPLLLVRGVVAAMALAGTAVTVAVVALVAVTRGYEVSGVIAIGIAAVHVPTTLFSSVVHQREETGTADREATPSPVPMVAIAAAAVVAVIAVVGGVAGAPPAPAEADPVLRGVAGAHRDLNSAVGWDAWRPRALDDTPARLRRAAALTSNGAPELMEAADRIERARAEDNRSEAVIAHGLVASYERRAREARTP